MSRGRSLVIAAAALVLLGIWGWRWIFPGPEQVVKRRLLDLAKAVSFEGTEPSLVQISKSRALANFFAEEVLIQVDLGGSATRSLSGREDLFQTAVGMRRALGALSVEFLDMNISIGPDARTADVDLTAKIRVPSDRDMIVQELRLTFRKIGREWLVRRVETVKTLALAGLRFSWAEGVPAKVPL